MAAGGDVIPAFLATLQAIHSLTALRPTLAPPHNAAKLEVGQPVRPCVDLGKASGNVSVDKVWKGVFVCHVPGHAKG